MSSRGSSALSSAMLEALPGGAVQRRAVPPQSQASMKSAGRGRRAGPAPVCVRADGGKGAIHRPLPPRRATAPAAGRGISRGGIARGQPRGGREGGRESGRPPPRGSLLPPLAGPSAPPASPPARPRRRRSGQRGRSPHPGPPRSPRESRPPAPTGSIALTEPWRPPPPGQRDPGRPLLPPSPGAAEGSAATGAICRRPAVPADPTLLRVRAAPRPRFAGGFPLSILSRMGLRLSGGGLCSCPCGVCVVLQPSRALPPCNSPL